MSDPRFENPRATRIVSAIGGGAVAAGFAAATGRLCYATPYVTSLLGSDFYRLAHSLEPYRSLFLFLTLALVLLGAGLAYLPPLATPARAVDLRVGVSGRIWLLAAIGASVVAVGAPYISSFLLSRW